MPRSPTGTGTHSERPAANVETPTGPAVPVRNLDVGDPRDKAGRREGGAAFQRGGQVVGARETGGDGFVRAVRAGRFAADTGSAPGHARRAPAMNSERRTRRPVVTVAAVIAIMGEPPS